MEGRFFESVYWRFVLDVSESGKFQSTVKDKATIDVYWCVFIHFVAFCGLCACKIVALCVVHNSVGSALLVLTVMGIPEPLCVERVTVQFLRFFISINVGSGAAGAQTLHLL